MREATAVDRVEMVGVSGLRGSVDASVDCCLEAAVGALGRHPVTASLATLEPVRVQAVESLCVPLVARPLLSAADDIGRVLAERVAPLEGRS